MKLKLAPSVFGGMTVLGVLVCGYGLNWPELALLSAILKDNISTLSHVDSASTVIVGHRYRRRFNGWSRHGDQRKTFQRKGTMPCT
jgi:hypothetical protein